MFGFGFTAWYLARLRRFVGLLLQLRAVVSGVPTLIGVWDHTSVMNQTSSSDSAATKASQHCICA